MSARTVFISYRRDPVGEARATRIHDALRKHGIDCFLDQDGLGPGNWEAELFREVATRTHFLLVLTPGGLDRAEDPKDILRREYEMAEQCGRTIVPIHNDAAEYDALLASHPMAMHGVFKWQGMTVNQTAFERDIQRLVEHLTHGERAPRDVTPPLVWPPAATSDGAAVPIGAQNWAWSAVSPLQVATTALVLAAAIFGFYQYEDGYSVPLIGIPIFVSIHYLLQLFHLPPHIIPVHLIALFVFVVGAMLIIKALEGRETVSRIPRADWVFGLLAVGLASGMWIALSVSQQLASRRTER